MASVDECRQALHDLAARLDANAEPADKLDFDRTLACRITDLDAAFHGRLTAAAWSTSPTATTRRPRSP